VARERARRLGVPCLLVSSVPTLSLLDGLPLLTLSRQAERDGWPPLDVVDMRAEDPRTGLLSEALARAAAGVDRAVFVVNRKGRSRLLACHSCRELARCEECGGAMAQPDSDLRCSRCGHERPPVCAACGGQRFRNLRPGLSRLVEELAALIGQPVLEVTGDTAEVPDRGHLVGTEAVLHRAGRADLVAFLDFDQELLAPRFAAGEQALALLARAARLTAGRAGGRVLVQTRIPDHPAVLSALRADPAVLAEADRPLRQAAGMPPCRSLALVSGAGAEELAQSLRDVDDIEVLGPDDGRWLLRAASADALAAAIAAAPRPSARVRVEVDPRRI
jgi:primosomal protein N' (replication factor Y) (superfamily II helicase)